MKTGRHCRLGLKTKVDYRKLPDNSQLNFLAKYNQDQSVDMGDFEGAMGYHSVCTMISLRAHRDPGALMNFSLRCHCVPTALLLECRVTAFVLSMSKSADPWRSRSSHGIQWSSHRIATALVALVPCSPRRSEFL